MFETLINPACGVPAAHYVNNAAGDAIVAQCARLRAKTGTVALVGVALLIVALSFVWRTPVAPVGLLAASASDSEEGDERDAYKYDDVPHDAKSAWAKRDGDGDRDGDRDGDEETFRGFGRRQPRAARRSIPHVRAPAPRPSSKRGEAVSAPLPLSQLLTTQEPTRPFVSPLWAAVPLLAAVIMLAVSERFALANLAVKREAFKTSELSKTEFVQMDAADRRVSQTANTAFSGTTLIASSGLLGRHVF